ncbi:hypothetical protein K7432_013565 [Basidiobolus ranarum]|uniref:Uncharacterized protein n=1 Tax=Basidiobolus ranarum TaxID=34480 RepID=A0ABR2VQK8_9FUNG
MDLNWCIICDKHIDSEGDLYCSQSCKSKDTASFKLSIPDYELHPGSPKVRRHSTITFAVPFIHNRHEHVSAASSLSSTHSQLALTPPDLNIRGNEYCGNKKILEQPLFFTSTTCRV